MFSRGEREKNLLCVTMAWWLPQKMVFRFHTHYQRKKGKKRPLGKTRRRWKDIKTDLKEILRRAMDRIQLAKDRVQWRTLVNMLMNIRVL
jgi:hypothetical protein